MLNEYVLNFKITTPEGRCGFQVKEQKDVLFDKIKVVALHNCVDQDKYGVNLSLYFRASDLATSKVEKVFKVIDSDTDAIIFDTKLLSCGQLSAGSEYARCEYYLSPSNPRMGLLMDMSSGGLLTYRAKWVENKE